MFHLKSYSRSNVAKAVLLTLSLTALGATAAIADELKPNKTTTAYEESQAPVTDSWITTKVKAELLANEDVKGLDINVSTTNGVVTLAGVLDSKVQVDTAIRLAKAVKGVTSVNSVALKVKPAM